jgi:ferredoxin-NADP reductase
MTIITFDQKKYELHDNESVLDGLIRHKVTESFHCKLGTCQTCLLQSPDQKCLSEMSQKGLPSDMVDQGFFYSCQLRPETSLAITSPKIKSPKIRTKIIHKEKIHQNIVTLHLKPQKEFSCKPGQHIELFAKGLNSRFYSVSNRFEHDNFLEINVRKKRNGKFSSYLFHDINVGDFLHIKGPRGFCHYKNEHASCDLLLVGTTMGLSPLLGIAHDALHYKHPRKITLMHGCSHYEKLFHQEKLRDLMRTFSNFSYVPCVLFNDGRDEDVKRGSLSDIVPNYLFQPDETQVFVCSDMVMSAKMIKLAFLEGVPASNIVSDIFFYRQFNTKKAW